MSDVENETPELYPPKVFRVYKQTEKGDHLKNEGTIETDRHRPDAEQLGKAFGEGTYLVYEENEYNVGRRTGEISHCVWTTVKATTWFSESWDETD